MAVGRAAFSVPQRRALLGATASLGLAAVLGNVAGCGFALRRAPELRFATLLLTGFAPRSPLALQLRRDIDASPATRVVDTLEQAQVVLDAVADERLKVVVASTSVGQVTEFQLRARFAFRLRSVAGKELIPSSEIRLTRDMSYTETTALAKELEEASLYRTMQNDIVAQVLRRLASVQAF